MLPNLPIAYPNSSFSMVEALKTACAKYETVYPVLQGVRVATERKNDVDKQILITPIAASYTPSGGMKKQLYNINFFSKSFDDAEDLGTALEVAFQSIRNEVFHWVQIHSSPVEVPASLFPNENHRWMTLETLIAGKSISL